MGLSAHGSVGLHGNSHNGDIAASLLPSSGSQHSCILPFFTSKSLSTLKPLWLFCFHTVSICAIREGNWEHPTVVLHPGSAVITRLPLNPKEHQCWVHAARGLPPSSYDGKEPWKRKSCPEFCSHHFESWWTGNYMTLLFLRWETAYEVLFFKMLLEIEFFRFI